MRKRSGNANIARWLARMFLQPARRLKTTAIKRQSSFARLIRAYHARPDELFSATRCSAASVQVTWQCPIDTYANARTQERRSRVSRCSSMATWATFHTHAAVHWRRPPLGANGSHRLSCRNTE